jgi:hypothetical protein
MFNQLDEDDQGDDNDSDDNEKEPEVIRRASEDMDGNPPTD